MSVLCFAFLGGRGDGGGWGVLFFKLFPLDRPLSLYFAVLFPLDRPLSLCFAVFIPLGRQSVLRWLLL